MSDAGMSQIVGLKGLTPDTEQQILALRELCRRHEPVELPLYPGPLPDGDPGATVFLASVEDQPVGFAWLPVGDPPELIAAVHPDYRRRGIGRQLAAAASDETRRRGCSELILVGEAGAPAGLGFAPALGAAYDSAEYQLELRAADFVAAGSEAAALVPVKAEREDAQLLAQIGAEAYGPEHGPSQERISRWFDEPNIRYYLGRVEGVAVGSLRVVRELGDPTAHIYTFGVRSAYQRHGYGRSLLNATLTMLFAEGCTAVRLEVDTNNVPALGLYRSCGFRPVTEYRYYRLPT